MNAVFKKTYRRIFIMSLFIVALNWKGHKCPSVREWKTVIYIDNDLLQNNTNELIIGSCDSMDNSEESEEK